MQLLTLQGVEISSELESALELIDKQNVLSASLETKLGIVQI